MRHAKLLSIHPAHLAALHLNAPLEERADCSTPHLSAPLAARAVRTAHQTSKPPNLQASDEMEREAIANIDGGVDEQGTARIYITGCIAEVPGYIACCCGVTSPSRVAAVMDNYRDNAQVKQVWFIFDSPGGETTGIHSLAKAIADYPHPCHAVVTGMCCSAAYWLASQCQTIAANPEAIIGAIGVYALLWDDSEALAREGIKTTLIATGELKGAGAPGQPYTDAQIDNEQQVVNDLFALFRTAVETRRTVADEVFSGGVYIGERARSLGLLDIVL